MKCVINRESANKWYFITIIIIIIIMSVSKFTKG